MIVVLNKTDLLPPERRNAKIEKMTTKVRKILAATRFSAAPIVSLAAFPGGAGKGGAGAAADPSRSVHAREPDTLASASTAGGTHGDVTSLLALLLSTVDLPIRPSSGHFLMAVDHCFAVKGHGTVLTGTALQGRVSVGQDVEVVHLRNSKKVKSIQMFRKPVGTAAAGDRLGLCVAGLNPSGLERAVVATPGTVREVDLVVALVQKVRFFKGGCPSGGRFHLTVGHSTVMGTATFFGASELATRGIGALHGGTDELIKAEEASARAAAGHDDGHGAGHDDGDGEVEGRGGGAISAGLEVPFVPYEWDAMYEW